MASFGPEYDKINTVWKRDEKGIILPGEWSTPEFAYLADLSWRWTEKVDGTNIRVHWSNGYVTFGGRTDNAQVPATLVANLNWLTDPTPWGELFPDSDVTVYGEGYGAKIQSGGQYRQDQSLIVFDVRVGDWWLRPDDVADVCKNLGLDVVPLVSDSWNLHNASGLIMEAASDPAFLSSHWSGAKIEGLVGRPAVDLFDRKGERILTKLKVKDYEKYLRTRGKECIG